MKAKYKPILMPALGLAILLPAGCREHAEVGEERCAITFVGEHQPEVEGTRAGGQTPLYQMVNDFTVYGVNGTLTGTNFTRKSLVYDNYVLWHPGGTGSGSTSPGGGSTSPGGGSSSTTNTSDWEYVGEYTTAGGINADHQQVKYWDYSQNCHYFWAIASADNGQFVTQGSGSAAPQESEGYATFDSKGRVGSYTKSLSLANNGTTQSAFYYSDICRVAPAAYGQPVQLRFNALLSRVRVGFYEVIPGVVINNLRFYLNNSAATAEDGAGVVLFGDDDPFITEGIFTLTFDYEAEAISLSTVSQQESGYQDFGAVQYKTLVQRESGEEDGITATGLAGSYLARESTAPSYALGDGAGLNDYYMAMLPNTGRTAPLTLKCDYVATETASGATTVVQGATVTIPVEYVQWKPNYAYTYVVKISEIKKMSLDLAVMTKWQAGYGGEAEW